MAQQVNVFSPRAWQLDFGPGTHCGKEPILRRLSSDFYMLTLAIQLLHIYKQNNESNKNCKYNLQLEKHTVLSDLFLVVEEVSPSLKRAGKYRAIPS